MSLLAIAKANNLNIELVNTNPGEGVSDDYRKLNKLGRIPTFEGSDGYLLTECIAIAVYRTWHFPPVFPLARCCINCMLERAWPWDEKHIHFSYPCLKTIVENYSHSESPMQYRDKNLPLRVVEIC